MDMPIHPGDPLTPGWGAEKGGKKLDVLEARTLVKIPVLPISYGDALPLLENIGGTVAPEDWRGALPTTYHVGPGPAKVHLKLAFEWKRTAVLDQPRHKRRIGLGRQLDRADVSQLACPVRSASPVHRCERVAEQHQATREHDVRFVEGHLPFPARDRCGMEACP